ncbi:MAG: TolC family protein [Pseudomonadota bacterium]
MRRRAYFLSLCVLGVSALEPVIASKQVSQVGSLYPASDKKLKQSPIGKALGPAAFFLSRTDTDSEFQAAIRDAITAHPSFGVTLSERGEARAAIRAERAALYPRLSASVDGDYVIARNFNTGTDNVVDSLLPGGQVNVGLNASQLIYDGGATFARIRSARAEKDAADQSLNSRIDQLALSSISAFQDLAVHQAILALGEEYIRRHEKLLKSVQERERLGGGTRADVMRAAGRLAAAKVRVSEFRESTRYAEVRYREFFPTDAGRLRRPSYESLAVGDTDEAISLAIQRNPDIAASLARHAGLKAELKAVKATRLPEVRANLSAVQFDLLENADDYDVRAGVQVNYDLYAGGGRAAAIAEAREREKQGSLERDRIQLEIKRDAALAFARQEATQARVDALEAALVSNFQARDLVAARFRAARGDLIDILQAENDWFEAGVAYLAGLADRDMALFEMMEFTGDLRQRFSPAEQVSTAPIQ